MYNEEIKNAYLRTLNKRDSLITKSLFDKSEALECFKQNDLSKFTKNDILYLLTSFKTTSEGFLRARNQQIRSYKKWFSETFKDSEITQFEISKENYQLCLDLNENSYFTAEEINAIIQVQPNPFTKFIIQALFEGIKGVYLTELLLAKIEYVDEKTHTMKVYSCSSFNENNQMITKERIVTISDKLIGLINECMSTNEIVDKDGIVNGYLENDGYIIKNRKDAEINKMWTKEQIVKKSHGLVNRLQNSIYNGKIPLTTSKIFYSGILDCLQKNDSSFVKKQYNVTERIIKMLNN